MWFPMIDTFRLPFGFDPVSKKLVRDDGSRNLLRFEVPGICFIYSDGFHDTLSAEDDAVLRATVIALICAATKAAALANPVDVVRAAGVMLETSGNMRAIMGGAGTAPEIPGGL